MEGFVMQNKILNIVMPSILAIASVVVTINSFLNPVKAKFDTLGTYGVPRFILALIFVLSLIDIIKAIIDLVKEKKMVSTGVETETKKPILPMKSFVAIVSIIVYFFLWDIIGFSISTILLVSIVAKILSPETKIWKCLLVGLGTAVICNLIFVFGFSIGLPDPVVDWIIYR